MFRPAAKKALPADKEKLRWHDLRHTAASLSLAATPSLHLVKAAGPRRIGATIHIYRHLTSSADEALADRLGKLSVAEATGSSDVVGRT